MSNDFEGQDDPRLREIYCLRGAYVSEVAHVEDWLDILARKAGRDVSDELHTKIKTAREIARDAGIEREMDTVLAALRRMQNTRRNMAHSRVTLEMIGDIEPPDVNMPYMTVGTKQGRTLVEHIDIDRLRENVRAARWLRGHVIAFYAALNDAQLNRDPRETLHFMRERLPEPTSKWLPDR